MDKVQSGPSFLLGLLIIWMCTYTQIPHWAYSYTLLLPLSPSSNSTPSSKSLSAFIKSPHPFLCPPSTSVLSFVDNCWGSGRTWAGCRPPHPQSERPVQLGWTPCLRPITVPVCWSIWLNFMSFEWEMGRGWGAEARGAEWRPLMAAQSHLFPVHVKPKLV